MYGYTCLLFLVGTLLVMVSSYKDPCSIPGSIFINGKCFTIYQHKTTREDAQFLCEAQAGGGTLAELRDQEEVEGVVELFQLEGGQVDDFEAWIAATDEEKELEFRWPSDDSIVNSDSEWLKTPGRDEDNKDCTYIRSHNDHFHLEQEACDKTVPAFVCQEGVGNPCEFLLPGAEFFEGSCFLVVDTAMTDYQAEGYCENMGAIVAEPRTKVIDTFVKALAEKKAPPNVNTTSYRLGGRVSSSNVWTWVRSNANFSYTDWTSYTAITGTTIVMSKAYAWKWVAVNQGQLYPFICQRDIGEPCEGQFPGGWYSYGQCFKYFDTSVIWDEAQDICEEHDSFLVEPKTERLNNALIRYLRNLGNANRMVFIGGQRLGVSDIFQWAKSQELFTYNDWQIERSEPDNQAGKETCAVLDIEAPAGWRDADPIVELPFVCQKEHDTSTKKSCIAIFPSREDDPGSGVIQVTSGFSTFPVYIKLWTSTNDRLTTEVTYSKTFKYEMGSDLRITSTGVLTNYVAIDTSDFVTVVLILRHENSLGTSLIPERRWVQDNLNKGKTFFIPSPSNDMGSGNLLTVTTMRYDTDNLTLYTPELNSGSGLLMNGVKYKSKGQATLTAEMSTTYESTLVTDFYGLNGAFLETEFASLVMIGKFPTLEEGTVTSDAKLGQVLPIDVTDKEYITFPSMYIGSSGMDTYQIIAIHEDTTVNISSDMTASYGRMMTLALPGEVQNVSLPASNFYHISSNKQFYVVQYSGAQSKPEACITSLFPKSLWRYQYDFSITTEYEGYKVLILCIVDTNKISSLQLNGQGVSPSCADIVGTSYSGCKIAIPTQVSTHHIHLTNHTDRFGAYFYAYQELSASCHPLGYQSPLTIADEFDVASYLSEYFSDSDSCPDLTTASTTPEVTTTSTSPEVTTTSTTPEDTTESTTLEVTTTYTIPEDTTSTIPEDTTTSTTPEITTVPTTTTSTISPKQDGSSEITGAPKTTATNLPPCQPSQSNYSLQDAEDQAIEARRNLEVNYRSTSAFKRTKISVEDERLSSVFIGVSGILFLVGAACFVMFLDLSRLLPSESEKK